ncbi:hypothetical protein WN55_05544 [Dufourea novaeangliae]|uniref:Uncharacterized protein n=1 Tax=Dufourea novaeangliae TaxID=178035 RepID=A0A154PMK5_DUFNO|nr:hypothetical protein WN55_05544 [Dufourea novaeangliae]
MNSINSMTEPVQNIFSFADGDHNCSAIDETTGEVCGETESLKIIDEFQKFYENRIQSVDQDCSNDFDRVCMKLDISKEWIKNLREQNVMLVRIVEDLEQATCNRVTLLEQKLKQSSMIVSENLTKSGYTEKTINTLSNRVSNLQKDEEYMRQRIEFLQNDIKGLLEFIRRASQENCWNLDGIKFIEIQPTDIPVPLDCSCRQEETHQERIQFLKLQIEQLQGNEKKQIMHQRELEGKLADLTEKLKAKQDTIKNYFTQSQNLADNVNEHVKIGNQLTCNSFLKNDQQTFGTVLVADSVEHMFTEKSLEMRNLQKRLHNAESTLVVLTCDTNRNINNLKVQLNEKCRTIQEMKQQMSDFQKESLEKQGALTAEVIEKNEIITSLKKQIVILQEQCHHANIQMQFKEDIIKEMRRKLKQTMDQRVFSTLSSCIQNHCNGPDTDTPKVESIYKCYERIYAPKAFCVSSDHDNLISCLQNCVEHTVDGKKETESLPMMRIHNLKILMAKRNQVISYLTKVKSLMEKDKDNIFKLKVELEKTMEKLCCENNKVRIHFNLHSTLRIHRLSKYLLKLYTDINQQYKLMDVIRTCAIGAQVTTKDIEDGMALIISTFKSRHQKYVDLNTAVINIQTQLIRNKESIIEAIKRLQLQEKERSRHTERISSGGIKLKDIKNRINQVQPPVSMHLTKTQSNMQGSIVPSYSEIYSCNDLVCSVIEEMEQTSNSLQVFNTQECCITSDMEELMYQLQEIESAIGGLQQKINDALSEHGKVETTLCQTDDKLKRLQTEVNAVHSKIQHISEAFLFSTDQTWNEDLHELRKEHDELKYKMLQKIHRTECDDKCLWKSRVMDLQGQVKILQHEAKCTQETNEFLRSNIELMEEALRDAQTKSKNYSRSHSMDSIELKKEIIQLKNTLKLQKEIKCTLRQQLNESEVELKKSKELLNTFYTEHSMDESPLPYGCNQFRHDTMTVSQSFRTLQNTMKSIKYDLQELKTELTKLIHKDQSDFCSSARSLVNLVDKLQKHEDELDSCAQEIEKHKNTSHSKDQLLKDKNEIIKIQKNSILLTQSEVKDLHQKLQEKIDNQNQIISQYEKEKKELSRQNELQNQTIGHLQNAVVEAKRCIDQMGHRTMSDLQEKCETIRLLAVCVEETQSQYSECFTEAAKQEKLLELQRVAIKQLQQKICYIEYDSYIIITSIHTMHYSMLKSIQEQLEACVKNIQALKDKIVSLEQYKKLWQEAERKLQELKKVALKSDQKTKLYEDKDCQCRMELTDRMSTAQDVLNFDFNNKICDTAIQFKNHSHQHELQSEIDTLTRENEDIKKQLQKCELDFDIIDKELKIERENDTYPQQISFELQKMRDTECCLRYENELLKSDLKKQAGEVENSSKKLQFINDIKFEKLLKKLEEEQIQIKSLYSQIKDDETVMKKQTETIETLEKKLDRSNKEIKGYLTELDDAEYEMSTLHDRIQSLKNMLIEQSNNMTKLQADYEVVKNNNSILKIENNAFESTSKDVCLLKNMLKEAKIQLRYTEENYHRVTEDYHKTQEQLVKMTKREADLQKYLTNMEKDYCSKISNIEKEKAQLTDCLDKLKDELEKIQENYAEQLEVLQEQVEEERERVKKIEESNCCVAQRLKECMEQNCRLNKEKAMVEQNNCEIISELQDTHKSLLELRKECQLKNKSLACISAELTETAISRSELCNQSQYVVSCIRIWMEEQRDYVHRLSSKLKFQQQQLRDLEFEKKTLLEETRKLKRNNHSLTQRLKRLYRYNGKNVKNVCIGCHISPSVVAQNSDTLISTNSKYVSLQKRLNLTKAMRRVSTCGNPWWFPKMQYLTDELRKNNLKYKGNSCDRGNTDSTIEESRDCGYQSSTSK